VEMVKIIIVAIIIINMVDMELKGIKDLIQEIVLIQILVIEEDHLIIVELKLVTDLHVYIVVKAVMMRISAGLNFLR